jgi:hypothetical protein
MKNSENHPKIKSYPKRNRLSSKVRKRRRHQRSFDSKAILKQSESEEAPNIQEATASNSNQVSTAILQDQVTLFMIFLLILFKLTFI